MRFESSCSGWRFSGESFSGWVKVPSHVAFVRSRSPKFDASGSVPRCVRGMDQVLTGARRGLPRRGLRFLRDVQGCFGFSACNSPAGRTSGRFTFSFTSSGGSSGNNFVESQSVSSRIIAQATTPSRRASAMPAFLRRVFEPPWIRANVSLLHLLYRVLAGTLQQHRAKQSWTSLADPSAAIGLA